MRIFKIALLAMFVASTLIVSTGTASAAVPCTRIGYYQDDYPNRAPDVDFFYQGNWTHSTTSAGAIHKTESYAKPVGLPTHEPRVSFTLNCVREFEIYYAKAFNRANLRVVSNGVAVKTIDQYDPDILWAQKTTVYLPPGINNVFITVVGSNPNSTAEYIGFDGITPTRSW